MINWYSISNKSDTVFKIMWSWWGSCVTDVMLIYKCFIITRGK